MAKGRFTGGRQFQKGHKPYTSPLTPEIVEMRKMNLMDFISAAQEILHMTPEQAKVLASNTETPYYKRIILKVIGNGDFREISILFDRLFGKVTENINSTVTMPIEAIRAVNETVQSQLLASAAAAREFAEKERKRIGNESE